MRIDCHVHIVGTGTGGSGCWYRPKGLTRYGEPLLTRAVGLVARDIRGPDFDQLYVSQILKHVRESRLIDRALPFAGSTQPAPQLVVEVVCMAVEHVLANPVMAKVIADDPELIGAFLHRQFAEVVDRFTATLSPFLAAAMKEGRLAKSDPVYLTQWTIRIAITLLLAPPPGPLRPFVAAILLPALTPPGSSGVKAR